MFGGVTISTDVFNGLLPVFCTHTSYVPRCGIFASCTLTYVSNLNSEFFCE